MNTFAIRLAPALTLLAAVITTTPAFAGDVKFSYSNSDLASSATISALYERIEKKADRACSLYQSSGLLGYQYHKACVAPLIGELVSGIDHPTLTALHQAHTVGQLADSR